VKKLFFGSKPRRQGGTVNKDEAKKLQITEEESRVDFKDVVESSPQGSLSLRSPKDEGVFTISLPESQASSRSPSVQGGADKKTSLTASSPESRDVPERKVQIFSNSKRASESDVEYDFGSGVDEDIAPTANVGYDTGTSPAKAEANISSEADGLPLNRPVAPWKLSAVTASAPNSPRPSVEPTA
jgi:hypothetical protein